MNEINLAPWRDAAIVLLAIEAFIIGLLPLVAAFFAVRGLRAVRRLVGQPLKSAQLWAMRIQRGTTRASDRVAAVPIGIATRATLVSTTTRGVVNFLLGK